MPTHSKIMDYWKDKCITHDFKIAIEGEYAYDKSIPVVKDYGEPTCWCCGEFISDIYKEPNYEEDLNNHYRKVWNYKKVKSNLNRCHIIPRALGGSDEPCNLFLMCPRCHEESPDFIDSTYFFAFVYVKRREYLSGQSMYELKKYIEYIVRVSKELNKDLSTLNKNKINYSKYNTHGYTVATSTLVASLVDAMEDLSESNMLIHTLYKLSLENMANKIDLHLKGVRYEKSY